MSEDQTPYLVSYQGDDYMGFKEDGGWSLIPISEDHTKIVGDSFNNVSLNSN